MPFTNELRFDETLLIKVLVLTSQYDHTVTWYLVHLCFVLFISSNELRFAKAYYQHFTYMYHWILKCLIQGKPAALICLWASWGVVTWLIKYCICYSYEAYQSGPFLRSEYGACEDTFSVCYFMLYSKYITSCSMPCYTNFLSAGDVTGQLSGTPPTCPGDNFTYTCNVTGNNDGVTHWIVGWGGRSRFECGLLHNTPSSHPCGHGSGLVLRSVTGFGETNATFFISTLSGTATFALDGTLVECFGPAFSRSAGNRVGKNTLQILGEYVIPQLIRCSSTANNYHLYTFKRKTVKHWLLNNPRME